MVILSDEDVLTPDLVSVLNTVASENGIVDSIKINKTGGSKKGDGYIGVVTFIEINGKDADKGDENLSLVVKSAHAGKNYRDFMPINTVFSRESHVYNLVKPEFESFTLEKTGRPFNGMAKCFKTCVKDMSEFLIFQNLKSVGYSLWNRLKPMNDEHVSLVLKQYGNYHGISLAMRDQNKSVFDDLSQNLFDVFYDKFDMVYPVYTNAVNDVIKIAEGIQDDKLVEDLHKFKKNFREFMKIAADYNDEYSVLTHGDCWCNNMMFKYEVT